MCQSHDREHVEKVPAKSEHDIELSVSVGGVKDVSKLHMNTVLSQLRNKSQ